jgi:uncharacterized protein YjbI with pentapeptide repeats
MSIIKQTTFSLLMTATLLAGNSAYAGSNTLPTNLFGQNQQATGDAANTTNIQKPVEQQAKSHQETVIYANAELENLDLSGAQLTGVDFSYIELKNADLSRANLQDTDFSYAKLVNIDFRGADLSNSNFRYAKLINCDLSGAMIDNVNFEHTDFKAGTKTSTLDFSTANTKWAKFQNANMPNDIQQTQVTTPVTQRAINPNLNQFEGTPKERDYSYTNLNSLKFVGKDLRQANYRYAKLNNFDFSNADLRGADFSNANLKNVKFTGANLEGANFTYSDLQETDFRLANTKGVNFRYTDFMQGTNTSGIDFTESNMNYATMKGVIHSHVELSSTSTQVTTPTEVSVAIEEASTSTTATGQDYSNTTLNGLDLSNKALQNANFSYSKLINIDLSGADLSGADFRYTEMKNVNLQNAILDGATFNYAKLYASDMRGSLVINAIFVNTEFKQHTKLGGVDFSSSDMSYAEMGEADFNTPLTVSSGNIERALTQPAHTSNSNDAADTNASINLAIQFAFDSSEVKPSSVAQLYELAKALQSNTLQNTQILIEGHTDDQGSDDYNQILSENRATSVFQILTNDFGITPSRLKPIGFGESRPVANNTHESGRAQNRRVTIVNLNS